jgi:hypothetical protein
MWAKAGPAQIERGRLPGATACWPFQQVDARFLGKFDLGNNGA